jgi:(E)-4-hydroxy-3-methylbut-2-enyl-diphosphate synthase
MQHKAPWQYSRIKTPKIDIGEISMGNEQPVVVQSMANTLTHDVEASVKQAIEIFDAGASMVRFTVVNNRDAEALKPIKEKLVAQGYALPIVADVHFNPNLADIAAMYIDKVRINPGNYLEKRATFEQIDYTEEQYQKELEKLEERFSQFLSICTENSTAIRVGTNHGSLSDRIMSRYGDSPEGMVEATMEFLRICKKQSFSNVVISLKSSNTRVMIQAYRQMAQAMQNEGLMFPLHLGVTEAGDGEDGRVKSAVGIGALMHDGLGDTIRVSLTEHPAREIPVAKSLCAHFEKFANASLDISDTLARNSTIFSPRKSIQIGGVGGDAHPIVVADLSGVTEYAPEVFTDLDFTFGPDYHLEKGRQSPDVLFTGEQYIPFSVPEDIIVVTDSNYWDERGAFYPLFTWGEYLITEKKSEKMNWVLMNLEQLDTEALQLLQHDETVIVVLHSFHPNPVLEQRAFINRLEANGCNLPVVIQQNYKEFKHEDFQLKAAADNGIFFTDALANGLWLKNAFKSAENQLTQTAFSILQASRARFTKNEYIACPSCGRTLFNLEATLRKVREATQHLNGLKIAVMGCIVNGPGEMADADFGYVGSGPGKVTLYKGKEVVQRNIDAENAVQELLQLIEKYQ